MNAQRLDLGVKEEIWSVGISNRKLQYGRPVACHCKEAPPFGECRAARDWSSVLQLSGGDLNKVSPSLLQMRS